MYKNLNEYQKENYKTKTKKELLQTIDWMQGDINKHRNNDLISGCYTIEVYKNKIPVQNFFSDQKLDVSKKLNVKVMPTTIIINNKLEEVSRVVGYIDWKDPKVLNFLRELL